MIPRYWVIAPYELKQREVWERVWQYDLTNNVISIGWGIDEDPSRYAKTRLRMLLRELYATNTARSIETILRMVWSFYHEIKPGDIVIARRGLKTIAAVGTVRRKAYYDRERVGGTPDNNRFENFLDVDWHAEPREVTFDRQVFGQPTLLPITEEKYRFLRASASEGESPDVDEESFPEGREVYRLHRAKERNREVVQAAKSQRSREDPMLRCDICRLSFAEEYGTLGEGFIEAHHTVPISECSRETQTRVKDIALVCSNCHRMLHRRRPWLRMHELTRLRTAQRTT